MTGSDQQSNDGGDRMEPSTDLEARLRALSAELAALPPGTGATMWQRLQEAATTDAVDPARLTGIAIRAGRAGGVRVVAADGRARAVAAGKEIVLQPATLPPVDTEDDDAGATPLRARPKIGGLVCIRIESTAKRNTSVEIDPSGVLRNWAQWGPMQLVVRQVAPGGGATIEPLAPSPTSWTIAPGAALELLGVGYVPRLSVPAVFRGPSGG